MTPATRRNLLLGAAAGLSVGGLAAAQAQDRDHPDINDRFWLYQASHQNGPNTLSLFWYRGVVFAVAPGRQSQPILSVEGFSQCRAVVGPDGRMRTELSEAGYYGDLDRPGPAETLINRVTGRPVHPKHYLSAHQVAFITPDGVMSSPLADKIPGARVTGALTAATRSGDDIFYSENMLTLLPAGIMGQANPISLTSLANYTVRASDLRRPGVFVPTSFDYASIGPNAPWLEMGDQAGLSVMRLTGRKLASIDDIPEPLRRRIEADHPGWIAAPGI